MPFRHSRQKRRLLLCDNQFKWKPLYCDKAKNAFVTKATFPPNINEIFPKVFAFEYPCNNLNLTAEADKKRLQNQNKYAILYLVQAGVVKLADALDSKSSGSDTVPVQVRPPAPSSPQGDIYHGKRKRLPFLFSPSAPLPQKLSLFRDSHLPLALSHKK